MSRVVTSSRAGLITVQNLFIQSEDPLSNATVWSTTQSTITTGQSDPFGGSRAFSIVPAVTSNAHRLNYSDNNTIKIGMSATYACYAKANGYNFLYMGPQNANTWINLNDGSLGTTSSATTVTITSVGNGWYFCKCVMPSLVGTSISVPLRFGISVVDGAITFTGNGTSGIYLYATQCNYGPSISSYVKTTTTAFNASGSFRGAKQNRVVKSNRISIP